MAASTRLRRIEKHLSPKQIVLMDIQEARRFPDIVAYTQAVVRGQACSGGALCERIEAAVLGSLKGMTEERRVGKIREAQREGLFLSALALECNSALATIDTELRMTSALIASQLLLVTLCRDKEIRHAERIDTGRMLADVHLRKLTGLIGAARLIEREYFDGQRILFPDIEALIEELRGFAETLAEAFREAADERTQGGRTRRGRPKDGSPDMTALDAGNRAASWVTMARAKTHEKMGEDTAGMKVARQLLG